MLFLDTSALIKRYVDEDGTELVLDLMERDTGWAASALAEAETQVTLCHLGFSEEAVAKLLRRVRIDWDRFLVVPLAGAALADAVDIGCSQKVRTLDAIHLAAASALPGPVTFLTFDHRQAQAAMAIGLEMPSRG